MDRLCEAAATDLEAAVNVAGLPSPEAVERRLRAGKKDFEEP